MDADHAHKAEFDSLPERIIGGAFKVLNALGAGFLENVYENALAIELRSAGLTVAQQHAIITRYADQIVGDYRVDLMVEEKVLVELKVVRVLDEAQYLQCLNYLRGSDMRLCLLLNLRRPRLEIKRAVHRW